MNSEISLPQDAVRLSSRLEEGDYLPYFLIENADRKLDIQVKAGQPLLLGFAPAAARSRDLRRCLALDWPCPFFLITPDAGGIRDAGLFHHGQVHRLFMAGETGNFGLFLCSPNLKILKALRGEDIVTLREALPPPESPGQGRTRAPVLMVPEVISSQLAARLISYYEENEERSHRNSGSFKSRSHLQLPRELCLTLDDKLCKSLLPEIAKVFYADISHRETYKVCCYDSSAKGAFGKHRDTIHPYLHRRYAMTLALNDDFADGGVVFPEYGDEVFRPPPRAAIIFPGSLYHQVTEVGGGRRFVIISFFFTEAEAARKEGSEQYRFLYRRDLTGVKLTSLTPAGGRD